MSKANPDYQPDQRVYCNRHKRFKIQDYGGNSVCLECIFEILILEYLGVET